MKRGIILLVTATILWGGNYLCGRFLASALPPTLLNTLRWAISTVLLVLILISSKKPFPIWVRFREFALLGFLGIFAFSTLTYLGLHSINAAQAGMISAGIPIAILIFSPLVLHEHVKGSAWFGAIISILGVIVLILGKHAMASSGSVLGDMEIVLSCLAWGLYTVLGKRFGKRTDTLTLTAGAALYGTAFSLISYVTTFQPNAIHMTPVAWLCVLYVSTFASVGAYLAWNAGVKIVGAGRAAPYINLLPVWTVLFGVILLHEQVSWLSLAGGMITISGAVLASR